MPSLQACDGDSPCVSDSTSITHSIGRRLRGAGRNKVVSCTADTTRSELWRLLLDLSLGPATLLLHKTGQLIGQLHFLKTRRSVDKTLGLTSDRQERTPYLVLIQVTRCALLYENTGEGGTRNN